MRHLTALVLVLLLVAMPSCKYFKGGLFGRKARIAAEIKARQDSLRISDSLKQVQEKLMALEKAKQDSIQAAEEALAAEMRAKYNIIVGSFYTPEYATGLQEAYKKQGYDAKILPMKGSRFQLVAAENFEDFGKAVSRLKEFQDNIMPDAWIYIKK